MQKEIALSKIGEKLPARTAHRQGHSCIITIPRECADRVYTRYINRLTGVITLVPVAEVRITPLAQPVVDEQPEEN